MFHYGSFCSISNCCLGIIFVTNDVQAETMHTKRLLHPGGTACLFGSLQQLQSVGPVRLSGTRTMRRFPVIEIRHLLRARGCWPPTRHNCKHTASCFLALILTSHSFVWTSPAWLLTCYRGSDCTLKYMREMDGGTKEGGGSSIHRSANYWSDQHPDQQTIKHQSPPIYPQLQLQPSPFHTPWTFSYWFPVLSIRLHK